MACSPDMARDRSDLHTLLLYMRARGATASRMDVRARQMHCTAISPTMRPPSRLMAPGFKSCLPHVVRNRGGGFPLRGSR